VELSGDFERKTKGGDLRNYRSSSLDRKYQPPTRKDCGADLEEEWEKTSRLIEEAR